MAIVFDDTKSINDYLKKPESHPESFAALYKRQAAGLQLVSDDMEQERKEQEKMAKLREKSFERKRKLLYDNLDLILRHRDEILATPRYADIDVHYALKGGGCYIGPLLTARQFNIAGTLVNINFSLGSLLELWDSDQYKVKCKCGGTAVVRYFSGSPLSGSSVATAFCPKCKEEIHGIRNRSFGDYYGISLTKFYENIVAFAKNVIAKWGIAEAEFEKKKVEGRASRWSGIGYDFRGDGPTCNLETMINELKMGEI